RLAPRAAMLWARPETSVGQHGMPRTLLARPGLLHTSPRTSSVRPPMRSRPHVLLRPKARAGPQGDSSAGGSAASARRRFASSYLTTSGCGTTFAGRCLTAEPVSGRQHRCPAGLLAGRRRVAYRLTPGGGLSDPGPRSVVRALMSGGDCRAMGVLSAPVGQATW